MCMRDSSGAMAVMSAATARRRVGNVRAGAHASGGRAGGWGLMCLFQAEDGIRDLTVTGVQTCALPISTHDSTTWFGPGFREFAVAAPDSWPSLQTSGIPLAGSWRRTALAWALQSPELTRSETDGLLLLWRRDVVERLQRLPPLPPVRAPAAPSAAGLPRPREPFELVAPGTDGGRDPRAWTAQGFETGTQREFAALVAATIGPRGPELFAWRLSPAVRLPSLLVGSPQPPTAPGVLRLWNAGGGLLSEQALFNEPTPGGPPAGIDTVFLTWSDRHGQGPTPWAALRDLLAAGRGDPFATDTSLARRGEEARHLAAQAHAPLAAGGLPAVRRHHPPAK